MSGNGKDEGVRVLDECVCEAILAPGVPKAGDQRRGRNEGAQVIEELACDASCPGD